MINRHRGALVILCLSVFSLIVPTVRAQRSLSGETQTRLALEKLNVLGSVLMIAAHPDDENTALLAYFARGRKCETAYLSMTRGEGGQNLLGPEQGDLLGVMRTQELLAARRIDGARQFFTRAIDFGFSKSSEETFTKWGRERALADMVWTIRQFRPDVIVIVFTGTPRDGHGHHQASGILTREAFAAAADPARFPEQLRWAQPWQARRALWNVFYWAPDRERLLKEYPRHVTVDTGEFDPVLGYSFAEIAGMSRSMHRTQGFGASERKGHSENFLVTVLGKPATRDPFDGIDTTWGRLPGGAPIGSILAEAARTFRPEHPEKTVPLLLRARPMIAAIRNQWAERKLHELDEAIALCTGLWLDASADRYDAVPGASVKIDATVLNRSRLPLKLASVSVEGAASGQATESVPAALAYNEPVRRSVAISLSPNQPYSQPFWLRAKKDGGFYNIPSQEMVNLADTPPVLTAHFRLLIGSETIEFIRPVSYRYVDRVRGEQVRPFVVVPPVAVKVSEPVRLFPDTEPRHIGVLLKADIAGASGDVSLRVPKGWTVSPSRVAFRMFALGEEATAGFDVTPPAGVSQGEATAVVTIGGREISIGTEVLDYPPIPPQTVFPPAHVKLVRTDVRVLARKIGYVMGAGDDVPRALHQLGCDVVLLGEDDLARGDLAQFDVIVTGVRAYNVRADLRANEHRLLEYVRAGGTLVVQYNVLPFRDEAPVLGNLGPYPFRIGRGRVSVEEAPVEFLAPAHSLLAAPNRITPADFNGWIQERGLYFPSEWDPRYETLIACHDPGEEPLKGGVLFARYGKGTYVFTSYSWFRELPAGVPGAFRLFANFLSAGRSTQ